MEPKENEIIEITDLVDDEEEKERNALTETPDGRTTSFETATVKGGQFVINFDYTSVYVPSRALGYINGWYKLVNYTDRKYEKKSYDTILYKFKHIYHISVQSVSTEYEGHRGEVSLLGETFFNLPLECEIIKKLYGTYGVIEKIKVVKDLDPIKKSIKKFYTYILELTPEQVQGAIKEKSRRLKNGYKSDMRIRGQEVVYEGLPKGSRKGNVQPIKDYNLITIKDEEEYTNKLEELEEKALLRLKMFKDLYNEPMIPFEFGKRGEEILGEKKIKELTIDELISNKIMTLADVLSKGVVSEAIPETVEDRPTKKIINTDIKNPLPGVEDIEKNITIKMRIEEKKKEEEKRERENKLNQLREPRKVEPPVPERKSNEQVFSELVTQYVEEQKRERDMRQERTTSYNWSNVQPMSYMTQYQPVQQPFSMQFVHPMNPIIHRGMMQRGVNIVWPQPVNPMMNPISNGALGTRTNPINLMEEETNKKGRNPR